MNCIKTFIHGKFLFVSSVSLLSLGLSGSWSSTGIPGDSSPLTSPPKPGSEVSLLSDSELTFLFDCIESARFTVSNEDTVILIFLSNTPGFIGIRTYFQSILTSLTFCIFAFFGTTSEFQTSLFKRTSCIFRRPTTKEKRSTLRWLHSFGLVFLSTLKILSLDSNSWFTTTFWLIIRFVKHETDLAFRLKYNFEEFN